MPYLRVAGAIGAVQVLGLIVFCIANGIAATHSSGATASSAPIVSIAIFLLFAIGLAVVVRGLLRDSKAARAPYFMAQIFGLVIAYTFYAGDGAATKTLGAVIGAGSFVAIGVMVTAVIKMPDEPLRPPKKSAGKSSF